jgi:peptidoglycan/xylan/chitin deacetylase (PgdA/CDA1 family)
MYKTKILGFIITTFVIVLSIVAAPVTYGLQTDLREGMVSIDFDDGWKSAYTTGLPIVEKYGFKVTQGVISSANTLWSSESYMTDDEIKDMSNRGHYIGSHSVTHPDLTTLSVPALNKELRNSKTRLERIINKKVDYFIAPYCAFGAREIKSASKIYKASRGCFTGSNNTGANFNRNNLDSVIVDNTMSVAEVKRLTLLAMEQKTLLILVYHIFNDNAINEVQVNTSIFDQQMAAIKETGIKVMPTMQALKSLDKLN